MGMAASQSRYLALTARKTNCEYEGQQINQARTALANQSANLFNRLLDLDVPVAPKTTDYTELQYSFTDGENKSVLEEWTQLDSPNPDANYLVKHYYYTKKFTGAMKQLNDPQVQFTKGTVLTTNAGYKDIVDNKNNTENTYNSVVKEKEQIDIDSKTITSYSTEKTVYKARAIAQGFEILDSNDKVIETYYNYASANLTNQTEMDTVLEQLDNMGALSEEIKNNKDNDVFVNENGEVALRSDLENLFGVLPEGGVFKLPTYNSTNVADMATNYTSQLAIVAMEEAAAKINRDSALELFNDLKVPTMVGNCELTEFDEFDEDLMTQAKQIVTDMKEQNINDGISKCFDENGNYTGGIFMFEMAGKQYFTTYEELLASYDSHTGPNDIDGQIKLPYYNTTYIQSRVEETSEALLETDSNGRFKSVRFSDNSLTYSLNTETVTDDAAYQDALNEYHYKVQQYEKTIADINAKTSIIQQEDRTLELRLKQLDTEQNALATEMDAVKKVIKDNVEKTFKTFSD